MLCQKEKKLKRIKDVLDRIPICKSIRTWAKSHRIKRKFQQWERDGKPLPPPHYVKQCAIKKYADEYGLKVLVETGTYYGDMVEAMLTNFERIYSIELSNELYENAKKKFKNEGRVKLIHGDSGTELGNLVDDLDQPTLFWLDGHYSAGVTAKGEEISPVIEELKHIYNAEDKGHVILIDDAREFGVARDYPSVEELSEFIQSKKCDVSLAVEDDIIRVTPKKMAG